MKINRLISNYNHSSRGGSSIKYIVIHYVGGISTAYNNVKYFSGGDRQASAHYFVGHDGEIWQSVEDSRASWHCGGGLQGSGGHAWHGICKNSNSIGIEMCVRKNGSLWYFEDATVNATIELTQYLMKKYGVPASNVIRHYDVTGKICPAPYVHNNTKHTWSAFKSAIGGSYNGSVSISSNPMDKGYLTLWDTGDAVKTMQKMLIACGYSCGSSGVDGSLGQDSYAALKKFQSENGLKVDGWYGPASKAKLTEIYNSLYKAPAKPATPAPVKPVSNKIAEDGLWGSETTKKLQSVLGCKIIDGIVSNQWEVYKDANPGLTTGWDWDKHPNGVGSNVIRELQKLIGMPAKEIDGEVGSYTFATMQRFFKCKIVDGNLSNPSNCIKAMQKWLNEQ